MSLPTLFSRVQDPLLKEAITSCQALNKFRQHDIAIADDWVSRFLEIKPDVAIVEVDHFTDADYQRLSGLDGIYDMDWVVISSGVPNEHLDKLVNLGAIFHYRKPVDIAIFVDTLSEISQYYQSKHAQGRKVFSSELDQFGLLVGSSAPMHQLYRMIRRVARIDANVLITGESGSGKELVAQTIHLASERKQQPFIAINCGAISPNLVDSELFGYEKGAFTGANKTHQGVFKQAEGGTLFLDEITEMPIEHQVKLLRVLETGEYRPVGGQTVHMADVRIVAATNRDPKVAIEEQFLREDLFFRLSHFPLAIPPLRERGEDIVGLAKHFISHRNANEDKTKTILDSALQKIALHDWPGNVRELKHSIERAFIIADDVIRDEHLIFDTPPLETGTSIEDLVPAGVSLEDLEKAAIFNTLEENAGNKTESAQELGISVKTLYNKLEKYQEK
ncbi:sigma-54 interaction domain-containing protein [Vibrio zhugei]|uniref:Sigma-54 interaction domain-containing protein n=1 Tax=Vibrio zhugei TaxID=2479546 RepID=A0ABV7CAQ5_9VIBR|nr:sigma-54 dependent transcriptional regulator [Vibrio zhugei]